MELITDRAIALVNELGVWAYAHCGLPAENRCSHGFFSILTSPIPRPSRASSSNQRPAAQEASQGNERFADHERGVSIDGLKETNDLIRGIRGYFDLAMEGIKLLRNKKVKISVTLNRISAKELSELADIARAAGAQLESNILTRSLYFTKDADLDAMWPQRGDVQEIETVLRNKLKRPDYEVDYITRYYNNDELLKSLRASLATFRFSSYPMATCSPDAIR